MTRISLVLAALMVASPVLAGGKQVLECHFKAEDRTRNFIQNKIFIEEANGGVLVHDGVSYTFNDGKPAPGTITKDNQQVKIVTWRVKIVTTDNLHETVAYKLILHKMDGAASVSVRFVTGEYVGTMDETGTCTSAK